jgi:hypothetical protein
MAVVVVLCSLTLKKKSTSACLASLNSLKHLRQALHLQSLETKASLLTGDIRHSMDWKGWTNALWFDRYQKGHRMLALWWI